MRIALGGVFHETNTFSLMRTSWREFQAGALLKKTEILDRYKDTRTSLGGIIDASNEFGLDIIPVIYASATPGGMVEDNVLEEITDELCRGIEPEEIDGVILVLHGAMVTEKKQDAEDFILSKVRERVGGIIPVVCTTDLHANISPTMVELTECLVGFDTYPHTDYYERAYDATRIMKSILMDGVKPVSALSKPLMMPVTQKLITNTSPMKEIIDLAHEIEKLPEVLNVTIAGGFAYADIFWAGMSAVVTTNNDKALAQRLCNQLEHKIYSLSKDFVFKNNKVTEGVALAKQSNRYPFILVDSSDNVGGGSSGDGTELLAEIISQELDYSLVIIRDPEVVDLAEQTGIGGTVKAMVGGKTDSLHGRPVYIEGVVERVSDGSYYSERTGEPIGMGKTAVIKTGGITLILTAERVPAFDLEAVRCLGIEPASMKYIVVKGAIQWKQSYGSIAKDWVEVDTAGVTSSDLTRFPYKNIRRPIFPLDDI